MWWHEWLSNTGCNTVPNALNVFESLLPKLHRMRIRLSCNLIVEY